MCSVVLNPYAGGFRAGLVVEIGDSGASIVLIYEICKIFHKIKVIDIRGPLLTRYIRRFSLMLDFLQILP
ncbi:MAG: hypothetical protein ACTSRP_13235 [Candidatus Helarchaeota archaeon]